MIPIEQLRFTISVCDGSGGAHRCECVTALGIGHDRHALPCKIHLGPGKR